VSFLETHRGKVALVTIDIGGNDLQHLDAKGNVVFCPLTRAGCKTRTREIARNLAAILSQLEAAAGPRVPIVGMNYDDVVAGACASNPSLRPACDRMDAFNATLAHTFSAAGLPVADVAGAFQNADLVKAAANVCAWTWYCARRDLHPNTAGYHVIAQAFEHVLRER
jgi:lysophospholipase L1-like esterase